MSKTFQKILLGVAIIALVALVVEIYLSVAATTHGSTPKKIIHTTAGPYPLVVSLYDDPANAGFALPFAIAPQQPVSGTQTYNVTSVPDIGIHATPVHASISPDPHIASGVQGTAEIPVQGTWYLHIIVNGSSGQAEADVPVNAVAPPAIPDWLGWSIGLIPFLGLIIFLFTQRGRKEKQAQPAPVEESASSKVGAM